MVFINEVTSLDYKKKLLLLFIIQLIIVNILINQYNRNKTEKNQCMLKILINNNNLKLDLCYV